MQINFVRNLRTRITLIAWTIVLLSISTFGLSRPLPSTAAPSDPSLTLVGSIGGAVYSVAASESLIYVGEGRGALAILRNESSAAVHVVSRLILPNVVHDIKVAEGIAYLSLGTAGLYIVDVHIPEAPVVLSHLDGLGTINDVVIEPGRAYIASVESGMHIIDTHIPSEPHEVGQYNVPIAHNTFSRNLQISGHIAYVVVQSQSGSGVIQVVDLTNPAQPNLLNTIGGATNTFYSVSRDGTRLYAASNYGVEIFDISTPTQPTKIATYNNHESVFAVDNGIAYLRNSTGGLKIVNLQNPATPLLLGEATLSKRNLLWYSLVVNQGMVYLATEVDGLQMLDVSQPSQIINLHAYELSSMLQLKVQGTTGYVAAYPHALQLLDLTDAAHPQPLGQIDPEWMATAVQLDGNHMYTANITNDYSSMRKVSIRSYDISEPRAPVLISTYTPQGAVYDIAVANNRIYLVGDQGLEIVDITIPTQPIMLSSEYKNISTYFSYGPLAIQVVGNLAYIAKPSGWSIVDVSNGAAPKTIKRFLSEAIDIQVVGTTAYITGRYGLSIVDVSDPYQPIFLFYDPYAQRAYSVAVEGQTAYVTSVQFDDPYLYVFDVSDLTQPKLQLRYPLALLGVDVVANQNRIYVGSIFTGITILDYTPGVQNTPTATSTSTATAMATATNTPTVTNEVTPTIDPSRTATPTAEMSTPITTDTPTAIYTPTTDPMSPTTTQSPEIATPTDNVTPTTIATTTNTPIATPPRGSQTSYSIFIPITQK